MSQETVEIVRRVYQAWNESDLGWSSFAPDIEWDISRLVPDLPEAARGTEEVRKLLGRFLGSWRDLRFDPTNFSTAGNRVVVAVDVHASGSKGGVPIVDHTAHVFTLCNGLISRFVQYRSEAEALEAAGLAE